MKKLLALILCVMMFVAVIPTAAFAVTVPTGATFPTSSGYVPTWAKERVAKDAIDDATDSIMAMYQTLAADNGVFATVSAIDGVVSGISKELWKDFDGTIDGLAADDLEKATKNLFRDVIGNEIMNYMDKRWSAFASKNDDGTFDINPLKYMEVFATAASKAVSSKKAVANIQAIVTALAAMKTYDDFLDGLDDLAGDIEAWNDYDGLNVWAQYFGQDASVAPWDPYALFEPSVNGQSVLDMGAANPIPGVIVSYS